MAHVFNFNKTCIQEIVHFVITIVFNNQNIIPLLLTAECWWKLEVKPCCQWMVVVCMRFLCVASLLLWLLQCHKAISSRKLLTTKFSIQNKSITTILQTLYMLDIVLHVKKSLISLLPQIHTTGCWLTSILWY